MNIIPNSPGGCRASGVDDHGVTRLSVRAPISVVPSALPEPVRA
ncbi:MAG: hypothetical protein Q8R16_02170 [bacterium]|nr:hypothetical protein [bacterium]